MPDFRRYVRENLPALNIGGAHQAEIIEELAVEFEESYERALRNGTTPEEAWAHVLKHARPWDELARELRSELREPLPLDPQQEPRSRSPFNYPVGTPPLC